MMRFVLFGFAALASGCSQVASSSSTAQTPPSSATTATTATSTNPTPKPSATLAATSEGSATPRPPTGAARKAHLRKSCAPWDGAAMELIVDDQPGCSTADLVGIGISIWKGLPLATGKTYKFDVSS